MILHSPRTSRRQISFIIRQVRFPSISLPMEDTSVPLSCPASSSARSPKRRKLRKGTVSCWECKRRKAKCTFSGHAVCDGCIRRGTDCISQEVTEKPPSPRSNRHLVDRLGHVEASVRQLLKATRPTSGVELVPESSSSEDREIRSVNPEHPRTSPGPPKIASGTHQVPVGNCCSLDRSADVSICTRLF
jgi:hypothetical protein